MANESAIIIPVPEVEPIVGSLRLKYDAAARLGVPAHITVLYPFCPAPTVDTEIGTLRKACRRIKMFPFSFTEVRCFPSTLYLYPDRSETFVQITIAMAKLWPYCRPYNGVHEDIIPHLTVADRLDSRSLAAIQESLRDHLPLQCLAREIWLLTSDESGMWSRKGRFAFASST